MSRRYRSFLLLVLGVSLAAVASPAMAGASEMPKSERYVFRVADVFHVGGEGRWDLVAVDPSTNRLFVPRQTHIQVIDTNTGKVVGDIKDTPGVHGVALVPDSNRGFATNGKAGTVTVFDLKTLKVLGTVPVGENPDAIIYDPVSKKVFVFNGKSNDATIIDPKADPAKTAISRIPLGGKPELPVSDGRGRLYVNLENLNAVVVIDTRAMKLLDLWPIRGGTGPSGLAIDTANHRLFAGCENQVMAILDTITGKTLKTVPIGKGVDGCAFDPGTGQAFASCGDGTLTVVRETSPAVFEVVQTLPTRRGARTLALDPAAHKIYLPTAEFESGPPTPGKRPIPKPGTFMIVVVSSKNP